VSAVVSAAAAGSAVSETGLAETGAAETGAEGAQTSRAKAPAAFESPRPSGAAASHFLILSLIKLFLSIKQYVGVKMFNHSFYFLV
jgi:hypothetical protein